MAEIIDNGFEGRKLSGEKVRVVEMQSEWWSQSSSWFT